MKRTRAVLLALVAAFVLSLLAAPGASAAIAVIDANDDAGPVWDPKDVTIAVGDTVRWEFDEAQTTHNLSSSGANWPAPVDLDRAPNGAAIEQTFDTPGTYTFLCKLHGAMTGSVTVTAAADSLENVLVFSKTAGFRHDSIPDGIAAIEALGAANGFNVDATEDSTVFTDANLAQYDVIAFLSTTGDILDADQQAAFERFLQAGGGFAGIHAAADTEYSWPWYGEMLGGYFRNHPPGTPTASVDIEDGDEPSTTGLPTRWTRTDEWYNFQSPVNPSVGGGGDDYSPRGSDVKVLATVDESTYDEQDGNATNDDHPVSWCSEFDGGRVWYTAMGHTSESFNTEEGNLRSHILGGLRTAAGVTSDCGEPRQASPQPDDFEIVPIDTETESPMELDVAQDGRVFYVERITGELNVWNPVNGQVTTYIQLPVSSVQENGLMGIQLDPNFAVNGWLYVSYTPITPNNMTRVSRFTVTGNTIDPASEQRIIEWEAQRVECCHSSGSLAFDAAGNLYISTGDNTNPFASDGFAPIDERPGREFWDAQRSSANTNSLNGKIMRITPLANAAGDPGAGTTYTVPAGNMFEDANPLTRPEIYAMGFRNPFRITIDPITQNVLLGDYGPDAPQTVANRGPQGSVEWNVVTPGYYGWPYCVRDNVAYNDYDFATGVSGATFNCNAPVNNSPNNTGLVNLPPAKPAVAWMGYSEMDPRHPNLGTGGAPTGGPRYDFDPTLDNESKFPEFYDGHWFNGEWNNGWIRTFTLDDQGNVTSVNRTPWEDTFFRPHELEFGPDGSLYVIDWGSGFGGNNANSGIYRIDYVAEGRRPLAVGTATPDNGPTPLTVQFSSQGSIDPDGTSITYEWDFDGDGTWDSTDANPTHTYNTAGTFDAVLRVTDQAGQTGSDTMRVVAGNTRPTVTLTIPQNGQFADFGEEVPYEITVTDPEDGSINCSRVELHIQLGHDDHAHELSQQTGCSGTFTTASDSGHGGTANVFPSLVARYTDNAQGAASALTGQDEAVLQPKRTRAEHYTSTGRAPGGATGGTPGVQQEATTDAGGGENIGFIEHGDYVSFDPVNFTGISAIRFRVASGGAGGTIQLRKNAPDGELIAETANIAPTGGWQTWQTVQLALPSPATDTHELFVVFNNPAAGDGGLMNLNWFEVVGKGAAVSAAPDVAVTATPSSGEAPLAVQFDAEATDPDAEPGETLSYAWDFGVAGTTEDTSTDEDPTYTYQSRGTYTARVTVTDPHGAKRTVSTEVRVTAPPSQCPTGPVRSDEFDGNALDLNRWTVIRPLDGAENQFAVANGELRLPISNGSVYGPGTSAGNIIVQPLPAGQVSVTAKITTEPLTENYHQAGLRVYSDDDNWASVHMIHAGGNRDFEFIYESNGNPRNEAADKLGGIPADSPLTYWVRLVSDGTQLTAFYSFDGDTFQPVGRPASLATFTNARIGPAALSDAAPSVPDAFFDWVRFEPDSSGGGGGGSETVDEFDGNALGAAWNVVRQDQQLTVSDSALHIPAQTGDIYGASDTANNLVLRDAPDGAWTATAKVGFQPSEQYHQAGMLVYGDDANFTKLGRIATNGAADPLAEKFEFIYENAGNPRNDAADSTANLAAGFPRDYYVRIQSDGTNITGAYSTDGSTWVPVGRPAPLPANAQIGMFAFSNAAATMPIADFDWFRLQTGGGGGGPAGPSRDDQFDGSTLDKSRWNAIVRDVPAEYSVAGGELTITTSPGDIYTGDTTPPPNNFILQSADHAGADWVIETKIDGATINGGYGQGGLMAYSNGDNYVKFDAISDAGQTRINRLELRSETNGTPVGPATPPDPPVAEGTSEIWLRLTKAGQDYTGEYSFDGSAWSSAGTVTNAMAAPSFGLFAFGPQADGQNDTVPFDYFLLDGPDPDQCACTGPGDTFDGAALDANRWNAIVRPDDTNYVLQDGTLQITTVGGDIYTNGDPAATRNFILQDAPAGDWVIETRVGGTLNGGYEQGGLLVYVDDDNYIKYDLISDDGQTIKNRIELRSEVGGVIQDPQPQVTTPAPGYDAVSLRLTKSGNSYTGEYSEDGETWVSVGAAVTSTMAAPKIGLFTLGVNSPGGTAIFDYFSVNGNTGCEEPPPDNRPPVIGDVTATPTIGFGPLAVDFTATATDADEDDELTYSWDFDGDGTADAETANASHTYTEPGEHTAELTVSDGEDSRTRNVAITVLEPDDPDARFRVLVFSKTAGFRHSSIDEGHAAIGQLGAGNGFQVDHTEDATAFRDGILGHYDAVVWLSTTGDVLNDTQQAAFERFIKAGHGYAGIHAAADTEYEWKWYGRLVGGYFLSHPSGTTPQGGRPGTVVVEDTTDHSTQGLPAPRWDRIDEWYNYKPVNFEQTGNVDYSPRANVHVLASLDESTYDEADGSDGVDDDHPISWCQKYEGGRSWYTGMGHTEDSFAEAPFLRHILGGIEVAAGTEGSDICNIAPTVDATADPKTGQAPLPVAFSANGSDAEGAALTYAWDFGDGGTSLRQNPDHTYSEPGTYTAKVTVKDPKGATGTATVEIVVTNPPGNVAPTVEAAGDPAAGKPPLAVQFSANGVDPDGDALTYRWAFGDGGTSLLQNPSHTYTSAGTYTATVTVTDTHGATATATVQVTVGNRGPTVVLTATPTSGKAPLNVSFSATGSDPDGDALTYAYDFGDGSKPATGPNVTHRYAKVGVYTAKVTATDTGGATATAQVQITVTKK